MSVVNGHSDSDLEDNCDEREASVFTVHWLDNKHHYAMAHLNELLHETLVESKNENRKDVTQGMPTTNCYSNDELSDV